MSLKEKLKIFIMAIAILLTVPLMFYVVIIGFHLFGDFLANSLEYLGYLESAKEFRPRH